VTGRSRSRNDDGSAAGRRHPYPAVITVFDGDQRQPRPKARATEFRLQGGGPDGTFPTVSPFEKAQRIDQALTPVWPRRPPASLTATAQCGCKAS
jgi:hypothetical protein